MVTKQGYDKTGQETTPDVATDVATHGGLSFSDLRAANRARLPQFRNARGEPAHAEPDGSDWSIGEWVQAVVGELGEFANLAKKVRRGDIDMASALPELADELADVVTYLDILAMQLGVDLGAAVASKFNRVTMRVGADVWLRESATEGGE